MKSRGNVNCLFCFSSFPAFTVVKLFLTAWPFSLLKIGLKVETLRNLLSLSLSQRRKQSSLSLSPEIHRLTRDFFKSSDLLESQRTEKGNSKKGETLKLGLWSEIQLILLWSLFGIYSLLLLPSSYNVGDMTSIWHQILLIITSTWDCQCVRLLLTVYCPSDGPSELALR